MATLSPFNHLQPGQVDAKKRAVTLSRVATTNTSPVKKMVTRDITKPSDFTRVRRINTLRYVADQERPHPALKSKSRSLSGGTSSLYRRYSEQKYRHKSNKKKETNEPSTPAAVPNEETQEVTLNLRASLSSTSTSSIEEDKRTSVVSEAEYTLKITVNEEEEEIEEDTTIICSKCQVLIQPHDPFILFGDRSLHLDCFKCGQCQLEMGQMEIFLVAISGDPLCMECTPTCYTCKEKILQNHISVLKKDFHEDCLSCFQCHRKFSIMAKVYANDGEPCCSKCVLPVFNEKWSPTKPRSFTHPNHKSSSLTRQYQHNKKTGSLILSPSPSTDSGVSETASGDGNNDESSASNPVSKLPEGISLNPQLENVSRSIILYSSNNHLGSIKSSYSEPNLHGLDTMQSLQSVLFDEDGVVLFVNYCTNNDIVEFIVFWLDVEHFKHFDGSNEDLRIFAHHIITKYVGYYAEVPVALPSDLQRSLFDKMEAGVTQDMFSSAQEYVYNHMENEILPSFIQSNDGQCYLQIIKEKGLSKITSFLHLSQDDITNSPLRSAAVTNFDKRRIETKFYVYEVEIIKDIGKYYIYRRYSQWYSLNQSLRKAFPREKFPPLPKKIFLGRSQKKTVAQQRMTELQVFLQGLLSMNPDIVNSVILKRFFKQTEMDKEDEQFNYRIKELQTRRPS